VQIRKTSLIRYGEHAENVYGERDRARR